MLASPVRPFKESPATTDFVRIGKPERPAARSQAFALRRLGHNVTITMGLIDTFSIPMLLKTAQSKRIDTPQLSTHRFKLGEIMQAYDTFRQAADSKALKVIIEE